MVLGSYCRFFIINRNIGRWFVISRQPGAFFSIYVPGRMIFSGPLELGIPTAISNWFIRRRPLGLAADSVAKGAGLTIMPLAAQFIITGGIGGLLGLSSVF
ncbi:MAG: hypothetical protein CM1200mP27_11650 [Chloroflexota bacterium]|nr:MAG: hypothetical protein CM1200mP27_11650 [Chloroflexota bacterium]